MEDALQFARNNIGPDFYVEPGNPVDLIQTAYELDNQLQEEEVRKLKELNSILEEREMARYYEIQKLQADLAEKKKNQLNSWKLTMTI